MNTKIYKFMFRTPVHFGTGSLDETEFTFCADTFFSALYIEAGKMGAEVQERLYDLVAKDALRFSDAFPYRGDTWYLPKPFKVMGAQHKAWKQQRYIALNDLEACLSGDVQEPPKAGEFGESRVLDKLSLRGGEDLSLYRLAGFSFYKDAGLYVLISCKDAKDFSFVEELLRALSYVGIGGKRTSGMGKFDYAVEEVPEVLARRLQTEAEEYISLSVSYPADAELDAVVEGASYMLAKRSGFVASETYAAEPVRKKDVYLFRAGSCFRKRYSGELLNVSQVQGAHPVYRYAKTMFMGVSL